MSVAVRSSSSTSLSRSCSLDRSIEPKSLSSSQKRFKVLLPQEKKMYDNFLEASQGRLDASLVERLKIQEAKFPLYLSCTTKSAQGSRPSMEDAHFDFELPEGHLIGIFDGHGEQGRIAAQVSSLFQQRFQQELEKTPSDIRRVFIDLCQEAQNQITDTSGGSCALITYFHHETNCFYTATLGDSEMRIYRKVGDDIFSIPVSLTRDWCSIKDENRFKEVIQGIKNEKLKEQILKAWLEKPSKARRFPPGQGEAVNVSRSLGDLRMVLREKTPQGIIEGTTAISRKPKVSMCQALDESTIEDRVVFACDGLWDSLAGFWNKDASEKDLIEKVIRPYWHDPELAQQIVNYAIITAKSQDNVTVTVGELFYERVQKEALPLSATIPIEDLE